MIGHQSTRATSLRGLSKAIDVARLNKITYSNLPMRPIMYLLVSSPIVALTELMISSQDTGEWRNIGTCWLPSAHHFVHLDDLAFDLTAAENTADYECTVMAMISSAPNLRSLWIVGSNEPIAHEILKQAGQNLRKLRVATWHYAYTPWLHQITHLEVRTVRPPLLATSDMGMPKTLSHLTVSDYGYFDVAPSLGNWSSRREDYPSLQTVRVGGRAAWSAENRSAEQLTQMISMAVICDRHGISYEDSGGKHFELQALRDALSEIQA